MSEIRPSAEERLRLLDLVAVLIRNATTIALVTVGTVLLIFAISLILPDTYASRTVLIPAPTESDSRAQMLAQNLPPGLAARMTGGGGASGQRMVGVILKSQILRDSLARRVSRHAEAPKGTTSQQVYKILAKKTNINQHPTDGSVTVEVQSRVPKLAALIASEVPELVNQIATSLTISAAQVKANVLRRQVDDARKRLSESEQRLVEFQRQRGAADVPEQARQTMTTAAQLEQSIMQQEVRVATLRARVTPENPELREAVSQLNALRQQRSRLSSNDNTGILLSRRELPALRAEAARLAREFATDEQVYLSLTGQLASVQVDMNDNLSLVTVLDRPLVPQTPMGSWKRLLASSLVLGVVLGVLYAFAREYASVARKDGVLRAAMADFRTSASRLLPSGRS